MDEIRAAPVTPAWHRAALAGLDTVIVAYLAGLAAFSLVGAVDLGFLSVRGAAKPLLVLVCVIPLRVALGGRSWLANAVADTARDTMRVWQLTRTRVSPAVADTLFAFVVVQAASLPASFLANLVLTPARERGFTLPFQYDTFAQIFGAWDSGWYWDIATRGYYFSPNAQSSVAFFPLYPMLMRAVAAPFGGGDRATWVAGIAIALTAYALALIALHRLTERLFGDRDIARRTVLYVAVFPWSLFLTRVYAESVFLLTSVLAVSRAYDQRWWRAGAWGALATLARPNGILIAIPLALLAVRDRPHMRQLASRWAALVPIPAALAAYSAYVYALSGDPLGWMSAQAHWGYSLGHPPWQQLQRMVSGLFDRGAYEYLLASQMAPFEVLHGVSGLLFLAAIPAICRRLGVAMGAYVLVSLLVPLSSNTLEGLGRYVSVLFPAFIVAATITSARVHEAVVMMSLVFRTLLVCFLVTWQPIY
jgi:hypothetical protein